MNGAWGWMVHGAEWCTVLNGDPERGSWTVLLKTWIYNNNNFTRHVISSTIMLLFKIRTCQRCGVSRNSDILGEGVTEVHPTTLQILTAVTTPPRNQNQRFLCRGEHSLRSTGLPLVVVTNVTLKKKKKILLQVTFSCQWEFCNQFCIQKNWPQIEIWKQKQTWFSWWFGSFFGACWHHSHLQLVYLIVLNISAQTMQQLHLYWSFNSKKN